MPVPLADWGTGAMDALCAWAVACRHVPDDAQCRRNLDPKKYDIRLGLQAVAEGRIVYDGVAAARCFAATREAPCAAITFTDPSCRQVFRGQVAAHGTCYTSRDCAGGAPCLNRLCDEKQCCAGTCGLPPEPEAPFEVVGLGEACSTHTDCDLDAYCELDHRCTPLPDAAGEHCLFGCAWGDLRCDVDSLTCIAFAHLGESCGSDADCDEAYAYCDGVCRQLPGPGEPCDDARRRCIPTAFCVAGTCQGRGEAGAACVGDDQCTVGCDEQSGTCVAYAPCPE